MKKEAIDSALYAKVNPSFPELKIYFVADLRYVSRGICLYWVNEVHIDESIRQSCVLEDIIRHEVRHYAIIQRMIAEKSKIRKMLLAHYNSLWHICDCLRIEIKRINIVFRETREAILTAKDIKRNRT